MLALSFDEIINKFNHMISKLGTEDVRIEYNKLYETGFL